MSRAAWSAKALQSLDSTDCVSKATIDAIRQRMSEVNTRLHQASIREHDPIVSGSTVAIFLVQRTACAVVWAGDSRVYRLRHRQLTQLTTDHTWASELNLQQPNEEADHAITRAVGGEDTLLLDVRRDRVRLGDRYLLCSDGLTRELPDALIAELMARRRRAAMREGADRCDAASGRPRQRHRRRDRSTMKRRRDKTEHLPSHKATLMRPSPHGSAADAARCAGDRMTTRRSLRAPTEMVPATPSIRTRRSRPCARRCAETAARTLQAAPPTCAKRVRADVAVAGAGRCVRADAAGRAAHRSGRDAGDANRLVGSLEDAGEGHHGPLEPGSVIKKRFVLETLLGKGGMGLVFGAIDRRKEEARDPNPRVALKVLNADFQRHPQVVHGAAARSAQGADARASERRHGVRLRPRRRCGLHDDGAAARAARSIR